MMLQPSGGNERTGRHHGTNRKVNLSSDDHQGFAQGHNADQCSRQGNLFEIGTLKKARLTHRHRPADDEKGQDKYQFRDPQQTSDQPA
jgi:hypothetical protein